MSDKDTFFGFLRIVRRRLWLKRSVSLLYNITYYSWDHYDRPSEIFKEPSVFSLLFIVSVTGIFSGRDSYWDTLKQVGHAC